MTDDFEDLLRARLQDGAEAAPEFRWDPDRRPLPTPDGRHGRSRRLVALAVAAALVLIVGVGTVVIRTLTPAGTGGSSASCAMILTYAGHRYEPVDLARIPKPGKDLGTATACSDTSANGTPAPPDRVRIRAVPGVAADWAFMFEGQVWLADRTGEVPATIRAWQRPVRCPATVSTLSGTVTQLDGRALDDSPPTAAPYTITLKVTGADLEPLHAGRYQAVLVRIAVTKRTQGAGLVTRLSRESERNARLQVQVTCNGTEFRSTRLTLR